MKTAPELIDKFGGSKELAAILGVPAPTVAAWKHRKSIPAKAWADIVRVAREHKIRGVSLESLYAMKEGAK